VDVSEKAFISEAHMTKEQILVRVVGVAVVVLLVALVVSAVG